MSYDFLHQANSNLQGDLTNAGLGGNAGLAFVVKVTWIKL